MLHDPKWDAQPEVKVLESWRQLLLDAAGYIREHGWCQKMARVGERACVMQAMFEVSRDPDARREGIERVKRAVGELSLSIWNDRPVRTKEEVIATLEKVAME